MKRQAAIEDQALDWLAQRDGGDWTATDSAELAHWLDRSMEHRTAFWRQSIFGDASTAFAHSATDLGSERTALLIACARRWRPALWEPLGSRAPV